jgi:hypothetical protein
LAHDLLEAPIPRFADICLHCDDPWVRPAKTKKTVKTLSKLLAITLLTGAATSKAQVVSWNLNDWGDSPTGASPTAGVFAVPYWNDSWLDGGNTINLRDSAGAATTLDIGTASNSGTWSIGFVHVGLDGDGTMNREMLKGYLNGTGAASTGVTLSQIPYAAYDIYVYFAADNSARVGTVTDGTTTYSFGVLDNMIAGSDALFAQTTDTGLLFPEANYAVFSGLSGDSQTLSTSFLNAGEYGGISAIQVVAVPEPSSFALVGAGLAGLLIFRRRLSC